MPKVLAISRYFPPLSSAGGSIRLVKLMKYASRQGWDFTVLTQDPRRPVISEKELCGFLLDEVPEKTEIFRVAAPFTGSGFWPKLVHSIFKDSSLPWGFSVAKQGKKVIKSSRPDLIFVNSPPFTNVAVGLILSMCYRIPFVVDLKDDWVGSTAFLAKRRIRQRLERRIERVVFDLASAIITPTEQSRDLINLRYSGSEILNKVFLIPNGEDLEEYKKIWRKDTRDGNKRYRIVSAAAGYREDYRDLTPLLEAVEKFLIRCPTAKQQVDLCFLGEEPDPNYKKIIGKILPSTQVYYQGPLIRSDFVNNLLLADLFFLVQLKHNFTAISSTLFEYWATGKAPVLLFSEKGASSELVIKNNFGKHFLFDQTEDASVYIEQVYKSKLAGTPIRIDHSGVEVFDRQANAVKMAYIWNDVISAHRRN